MGKNIDITIKEKYAIKILKSLGISIPKIAQSISRNKSTIYKYLKRGDSDSRRNCGRKSILGDRHVRQISRLASKQPVSSNYIVRSLKLKCSALTLRRSMVKNEIYWRKCKSAIPLSKDNKLKRIHFCRKSLTENVDWDNVIFSDEKMFCMDGIQNLMFAWSKKNKKHVIMKRHSGGGGIMVWVAISMHQKSQLIIIEGRLNSERYTKVLEEGLLPIINPDSIFQQDNAPIHVSAFSNNWFADNSISKLNWPARSPDLNLVENVWAQMTRDVYANCAQYNSRPELKSAIMKSWKRIDQKYIQNLYKSIHKRLLDVIDLKGDVTSY